MVIKNLAFAKLRQYRYELLLLTLIFHLYIGIFVFDLTFYQSYLWPLNMILLGVASIGIFYKADRKRKNLKNVLTFLVIAMPLALSNIAFIPHLMTIISAVYTVFFIFILIEVLRFLFRPDYSNVDVVSAAACGFFLLIEIATFLLQAIFYEDKTSLLHVSTLHNSATFMDLVYFSSITVTTIGFGDITPATHNTKLVVSLIGVLSQLYTVLLVGILISKFSSAKSAKS